MKAYVIMEVTLIKFTDKEESQDTVILDNAFYKTIEDACNKLDHIYNEILEYSDEDSIAWILKERKEGYGFAQGYYDEAMVYEEVEYYVKETEL